MDQKSQILSTIDSMVGAFHRGDIDGITRLAPSVVGEPGAPVSGRAELEKMFAGFIAAKGRFTFDGHEVIQAGDIAVHLTPWRMTGCRARRCSRRGRRQRGQIGKSLQRARFSRGPPSHAASPAARVSSVATAGR